MECHGFCNCTPIGRHILKRNKESNAMFEDTLKQRRIRSALSLKEGSHAQAVIATAISDEGGSLLHHF